MRIKKEIFQILVWALAVIIIVPIFIYFFSEKKENEVSFSSEEDFSFIFESTEEVFLPQGAIPVVSARLEDEEFKNQTEYDLKADKLSYSKKDYSKELSENSPLVLIIHTYGTQSYCEKGYITEESTLKSENEIENVISAGKALKNSLEQKGIKAIHHKALFDKISYSGAYNLSTEAVYDYLKKYPSIQFVIDIQRDSLFTPNGSCVKAVTNTEKGKTAQISFISGSNENGADFPNWKKNLSLSLELSKRLSKINEGLSRGVCLMPSGYGQYSSEGYITVKIGTAGNTPKEAENASELLSEALSELILP